MFDRAVSFLGAVALTVVVHAATAETLVEHSAETRYQMDVHVPDAVLRAMLPPGWEPNVATQGAAKDANLRVIFIDRMTINGPNNQPLGRGSNRLVWLAAPVRETATMTNAQMLIGGLTEDVMDAPGPFGVFLPATVAQVTRSMSAEGGKILGEENWLFTGAGGERFEMHIKYERAIANKGNIGDTRFYSAKNPAIYQISRQEQVLDIQRNVTTTPTDRVKEFSIKVGGGAYAKLFDGTEQWLSWDHIQWINRQVFLP
jgi:hypothetical protein